MGVGQEAGVPRGERGGGEVQRGPKEGHSSDIHVEGSHHRELCDMVMGVLSLQHPSGSQDRAHGDKRGRTNRERGLGQFGLFSHPMISAGPLGDFTDFSQEHLAFCSGSWPEPGSQLLCEPRLCPRQPTTSLH